MLSIVSFILGLVMGFVGGVIFRTLSKPKPEMPDWVAEAMDFDFKKPQKGDFIRINKTEQFLKENTGEVSLGDILEDE